MIKRGFALLILALLAFSLFVFIPTGSCQEGLPTVSIAFIEQSQVADVGPGDSGEVTFTGVCSVSLNQAKVVNVTFKTEDTWNSSTHSPAMLTFTKSENQNFNVTVKAPLGTSFTEIGLVTVIGYWTTEPDKYNGTAEPKSGAVARIDINQFFKFSVSTKKNSTNTMVGETVDYNFTIHNQGNFMDTFTISVTNADELSKNGISVNFEQTNVEILANNTHTVSLAVNAPGENSNAGIYEIKLKVTSDRGIQEGVPSQELSFEMKVAKGPERKKKEEPRIPGFELIIVIFALLILCLIGRKYLIIRK
jgi:hypothetical protein